MPLFFLEGVGVTEPFTVTLAAPLAAAVNCRTRDAWTGWKKKSFYLI